MNNVYAGGKTQYFRPDGTPDFATEYAPVMIEVLRKQQEKGLLPKTGGDSMMSTVSGIGGGGDFHFEQFVQYDRANIESINAAVECLEAAGKAGLPILTRDLPPALAGLSGEKLQAALSVVPQSARFHWQWKIKQMLDPNGAADSKTYTTLEKPPEE